MIGLFNGVGVATILLGDAVPAPELTTSGPVTSSAAGEVIENLDITADGTGITIAHANVTVRNCRVSHNGLNASGDGVFVNGVSGVTIENVETINAGAPDRGLSTTTTARGVYGFQADSLTLRRITGRQASSTVYLQECDGVQFGWIESHDTRGDFPRGQAIQFNGCTLVTPLSGSTNSHEDIPGTSYTEDTINVYNSPGTDIGSWRVEFGGTGLGANETTSNGVMVLIEQHDGGSSDGSSGYVEGYNYNNGFAGIYDADNCTITGAVRGVYGFSPFGNDGPASDAGAGPVLVQAVRTANATITVNYDDVNDANLQFLDGDTGSAVNLTDTAWTSTLPLVRNQFFWRNLFLTPAVDLAPRINSDNADIPPEVGDVVYLLPGRYTNDPTSRAVQWYRNGSPVAGATGLAYAVTAADVGTNITVGETPSNAGGAGAEAMTASIQVGLENVLEAPSDVTDAVLGPELIVNPGPDFTSIAEYEARGGATLALVAGNLQVIKDTGSFPAARETLSGLTIGATYRGSVTFEKLGSANAGFVVMTSSDIGRQDITGPGTLSFQFVPSSTSPSIDMGMPFNNDLVGDTAEIDSLTVRQVTSSTWTLTNVTGSYGQTDNVGNQDASLVLETTADGEHRIRQDYTKPAVATEYQISFIAKAVGGLERLAMFMLNGTFASEQTTYWDLTDGTFEGGATDQTMSALGDGWYECSYSYTTNDSTLLSVRIHGEAPGVPYDVTYAGNTSNGFLIRQVRVSPVPATLSAPGNTALPVISGTPQVGQTLSVSNGTWTGDPTPTYAYQWRRGGADISGATSSTFALTATEAGTSIDCRVTATNSEGSASALANAVSVTAASAITVAANAARANILTATANDAINTPTPAPFTLCGTTTRAGLDTDAANAVVLHVTNLSDYESGNTPIVGSLRWAVTTTTEADGTTAITGPRVVVFDVSGTIPAVERIRVTQDNVWIAGQTAPAASSGGSGGIQITGSFLDIEGSNVIVEHIRSRPGEVANAGDANGQDGLTIDGTGGSNDVLIRNVSVSHSIDELFSCRPGSSGAMNQRVSVVDCLFAEPLKNPTNRHEDNHNFGPYFRRGSQEFEFVRNIIGGCRRRCPGIEQATSGVVASNYVFDNGAGSPLVYLVKAPGNDINLDAGQGQTEILSTVVHNVFVPGAEDTAAGFNVERDFVEPQIVIDDKFEADDTYGPVRVYQQHNYIRETTGGTFNPEPVNDSYRWQFQLQQPDMWGVTAVLPYTDVQTFTLAHAGAWPGDRDNTDTRIISQITAGTHAAPSSVPSDTAVVDTTGIAPSVPASPFATSASGLTNIEDWLETLHIAKGGAPRTNVGVDVVARAGGVFQLESDGDIAFDPAGYFNTLYTDETGLSVVEVVDGSTASDLEVTVTGVLTPPTPPDASALRTEHSLTGTDLAIDFAAGTAAQGSADLALERLAENVGRGDRYYANRSGDLTLTSGLRVNGTGLLMTTSYINPIGEQSQFFELVSGGTAWFTTFFDRELQAVVAPDGGSQSVHCSMDRDSRSTMTSNDFGVASAGGGKTYIMSVWLKRETGQPDNGYVPMAVATGSSPTTRDLYWVGPVTDDWQWFHVTFTEPSGGDGAVGFSRDGTDVQAVPTALGTEYELQFFHAWGFEVREQGTIPNAYGGTTGNYLDRNRLIGAAATAAEGFTDGTIIVKGTGGGGNSDIFAEAATGDISLGFVSGQLAVKSSAGNVLTGVTPGAGESWELEAVFSGTSVTVTGTADGVAGTGVAGTVDARAGTLGYLGRSSETTGNEADMAIEKVVILPA